MTDVGQSGSMRMKTVVFCLIIGLGIGVVGGTTRARQSIDKNSRFLSQLTAVSEYENLTLLQYKYSDTDHARQAMQDLLDFINRVDASELAADRNVLEFDRSLTYMRLALLDEKSGNLQASRKNIDGAIDSSKKLGNANASEARLRQVAASLDSHLP
jgi:hypothetical protein